MYGYQRCFQSKCSHCEIPHSLRVWAHMIGKLLPTRFIPALLPGNITCVTCGLTSALAVFKMSSTVFLLSWAATIATIGLFLSGITSCKMMVRSGSTENIPLLPFVTTFLNCMMWASYGILKDDATIVPVNVTGMLLQLLYILCFFFYCKHKSKEVTSVLYGAIVLVALYLYLMHYVTDEAQRLTNLGFACVFFTVAMQASPLAAVAKVVRTKSTESMPFLFSFMMVIVSFLWLCYGTAVEDVNIQVPNTSGVLLGLIQLSLFCIYPSKPLKQ